MLGKGRQQQPARAAHHLVVGSQLAANGHGGALLEVLAHQPLADGQRQQIEGAGQPRHA